MPVVPIIAGIASAAAAAGTFTLAAGFTLANVAAGMAIVGGVSTALGAATGNKKLMKFGAIVGLGSAALGGIASLSGAASSGASGAVGAISPTALTDAGMGGMGSLSQAGSEMVTSGFSGGTTGLLGSASPTVMAPAFSAAPSMARAADVAAQATGSMAAPGMSMASEAGTQAVNAAFKAESTLGGITDGFGKAKGMLSDFGKYMKDNPELTKVGLGAMDGMSRAKAAELAAAEEQRLIEANRSRYNASILNQRARF